MVWLARGYRGCRSTIIVSILESGSGVGADMHAALGHCCTSQSCAGFARGVLRTVHIIGTWPVGLGVSLMVMIHVPPSWWLRCNRCEVLNISVDVDFLIGSLRLYLP